MVYSYTPTYYSSLHDTITSLCKSILPFPFKRQQRRLPSQRQADNLKWQQESFHRILHLIGLHREGIVPESDVVSYRAQLLESIVASPAEPDAPGVIRDKLLFLQELLYAKCISTTEYHASKRPLLQRLAAQGVEIDARDVVVAVGGEDDGAAGGSKPEEEEEKWSVIDLRDKETTPTEKAKKHKLKGAMSLFGKGKAKKDPLTPVDLNQQQHNPKPPPSILMAESSPGEQKSSAKSAGATSKRKKAFRGLFQKENATAGESGGKRGGDAASEKHPARPSCSSGAKKQWGLEGLKKWKRGGCEDGSAEPYLPVALRPDSDGDGGGGSEAEECALVASPVGEGPDTKRIKKKLHSDGSPSDFFIDKVLGDNIKKELLRIQAELGAASNANVTFSNDQIEAISTSLPVDKADLNKFFSKPWCDKYGDVVLEVVRKEFKDHVGEMEIHRNAVREKRTAAMATTADGGGGSDKWVTFDDDDDKEQWGVNRHDPKNPFFHRKSTNPFEVGHCNRKSSNPFEDDIDDTQIEERGRGATTTQLNNPFAGHSNNPFHGDFCNPFCGPNPC